MPEKRFTMLENNPDVMNYLARALGTSSTLSFYDVYSLTDAELLALIPRPVLALLVTIPLTPTWKAAREAEDKDKSEYTGKGDEEPVIWFTQTIRDACGSIGLIHCLLNNPEAAKHIAPGSTLDQIRQDALPKTMWERAKVLEESDAFETAHQEAAKLGDTPTPLQGNKKHSGQHFVAFVKASDGHLWELEGDRKGPLDRGLLDEDEDVLSPKALEMGLGRLMRIESEACGDLRFSAIALANSVEQD
ncbi:cysteine proteinase [Sporormia fimetaria CBS 119925]|uniref:Ubiquitin carboxyl-terminal hydrolase n=1 Tax=Sporormia fimetaria CBS 119925 TaxID=1340428 RepID=A0A6A6VIF1_9PLEO|nr:cysteine proteinase [Sporormia fimetaria CBS 119925]